MGFSMRNRKKKGVVHGPLDRRALQKEALEKKSKATQERLLAYFKKVATDMGKASTDLALTAQASTLGTKAYLNVHQSPVREVSAMELLKAFTNNPVMLALGFSNTVERLLTLYLEGLAKQSNTPVIGLKLTIANTSSKSLEVWTTDKDGRHAHVPIEGLVRHFS